MIEKLRWGRATPWICVCSSGAPYRTTTTGKSRKYGKISVETLATLGRAWVLRKHSWRVSLTRHDVSAAHWRHRRACLRTSVTCFNGTALWNRHAKFKISAISISQNVSGGGTWKKNIHGHAFVENLVAIIACTTARFARKSKA